MRRQTEHTKTQRETLESGEGMEQNAIKSVAFGGFDKQDVARYIEQISQETEKLREERDTLREQMEQLTQETAALREQVLELTDTRDRLMGEVERLTPMEADCARLKQEVANLRPAAEAHVMLREQVGAIECEARQRAAELEERAVDQMKKTTNLFREQYQLLMSTFETASAHMTAEMRKMEVSLAQLPRAMDQSGAELNRLAAVLEKAGKSDEN